MDRSYSFIRGKKNCEGNEMNCKIFYSWQSDIKESRNFISGCLKKIPKKLKDISVIEIDRDTQGIAGSPDIGDAIYKKIDSADIFVADVTIINPEYTGRKTPNPNVMIELGYAIKALGWQRILLLYNGDYGDVELLPFDINHQRMIKFSLQEEIKAEARKKVINNFSATISILREKNLLHGGQPEIADTRKKLSKILSEALMRVYIYYESKYVQLEEDFSDDFVIIIDEYFTMAGILRDILEDEQYFNLTSLLHQLKLAGTGTDDAYGWEYAEKIASEIFEPLYLQYGKRMERLSMEQILRPGCLELLYGVSGQRTYCYTPERMKEGKLVFLDDGCRQEAYDRNGALLCKGKISEKGFTGYKYTDDYEGEFINSARWGRGKELTNRYNRYKFEYGTIRRSGNWENDKFMEGIIYSVVLLKDDSGDYELVKGNAERDDFITVDSDYFRIMIEECGRSEYETSHCFLGDVELRNGEFHLLAETVKAFQKRYGKSELLDTYF